MKNSKTVSFRVQDNVISEIEKEAKSKIISTNAQINQILVDYVEFYRHRHRMRMLPIPEGTVMRMLQNTNDVDIKELVEVTYDGFRDWALVSKMRFTLDSFLEVFERYCRITGISYEYDNNGGIYSLVIRHDLNRKFSLIIGGLLERIFWELKKVRTETEITPNTIMIKTRSRID